MMRRPPPSVALKPSLLKHFLIVSIALTSCIAIFANGENAQAIQEQFEQRQAQNQALAAEKQKGKVKVVGGLLIAKGADIDSGGGEPTGSFSDSAGGGNAQAYVSPFPAEPNISDEARRRQDFENTGMANGPPGRPKRPAAAPKLTEKDIARILAASRARSGAQPAE